MDRLEVMRLEVLGDLLAELGSLLVGGAEVDAGPHSGVDKLLDYIREPLKAPRSTRFVAERAEANLVSAEEVLERVHNVQMNMTLGLQPSTLKRCESCF
ncbi:MAG: hypothetical protein WA704_09840 [Pseudolabrys sp.]